MGMANSPSPLQGSSHFSYPESMPGLPCNSSLPLPPLPSVPFLGCPRPPCSAGRSHKESPAWALGECKDKALAVARQRQLLPLPGPTFSQQIAVAVAQPQTKHKALASALTHPMWWCPRSIHSGPTHPGYDVRC